MLHRYAKERKRKPFRDASVLFCDEILQTRWLFSYPRGPRGPRTLPAVGGRNFFEKRAWPENRKDTKNKVLNLDNIPTPNRLPAAPRTPKVRWVLNLDRIPISIRIRRLQGRSDRPPPRHPPSAVRPSWISGSGHAVSIVRRQVTSFLSRSHHPAFARGYGRQVAPPVSWKKSVRCSA